MQRDFFALMDKYQATHSTTHLPTKFMIHTHAAASQDWNTACPINRGCMEVRINARTNHCIDRQLSYILSDPVFTLTP